MRIKIKLILMLAALLNLAACTPVQRPLKNGQGYIVLPISEKKFRIEYYSKTSMLAQSYWNVTAEQLCPAGFEVIYNKRHTLNFDMYVPIAGNNVNLGRQEFIQYGQVACHGVVSNAVTLTESKWKEFNQESRSATPVSDRWLTETLKLHVNHLLELPAKNSVAVLERDWGKPRQQLEKNNEIISVWMKGGDSWFPNQVALLERDGCLKIVAVIPGATNAWMNIIDKSLLQEKNLESLMVTGSLPAYFFRSTVDC